MRREVFFIAAATLAIVACADEDESPRYVFNKGCYPHNCEYRPSSTPPADDPPTGWSPPDRCPKTRPSEARTDLTSSEVRALLPGRYRSCSYDEEIEVSAKTMLLGVCSGTRCDVIWEEEPGSVQIWSDPTAFAFTARDQGGSELASDDWVRVGD